jgi:hypothetical protein
MNVNRQWIGRGLILALSVLLLGLLPATRVNAARLSQVTPASVDAPAAPLDTPTVVVNESLSEFVLHKGVLYWLHNCPFIPLQAANVAQDSSALRRQPAAGGAVATLLSDTQCSGLSSLAVDDADAIYFNNRLSRIERIPLNIANSQPISVTNAFGVDNMVVDEDFVYFTNSGNRIYRAPRSGGDAIELFETNFFIGDMALRGDQIYWFDQGGLWRANKTCDAAPCPKENFPTSNGRHMQIGGNPASFDFAIQAVSGLSIIDLRCETPGNPCPVVVLYTAAANTSIGEFRFVTLPGPSPLPILRTYLFWTEVAPLSNTGRLLRRQVGSSATPDELFPGEANLLSDLATDSTGVYFSNSAQLLKLPFNATAITRDLAADGMEVTQAIQNLANQAPLIADKPTYVRLYGKSLFGPRAGGVEAQLVGTRNGQPLPGSPLQPLNGNRFLDGALPYQREFLSESWLFKLPASWVSGAINLSGVIDPRKRYADTNLDNNQRTANLNFADEPNSCLFFSPVRTHNPLPKVGNPNFWETIDRFTRLWPKAQTDVRWMGEPIEELEFCSKWGVPYPCWGPYELDQGVSVTNFPSDKDRVIIKLIVRQAEARILALPPISMCEFGGSVHSVGLVHPQADTTAGNFTTNGYANLFFNASWYKMEPFDSVPTNPVWTWPDAGNVLAQEVTHNFWRNHIDCGNPEGIDNGWPYNNPCQLNDGGQTNYYGFDPDSRTIIPPEIASDFMSYQPSRSEAPRWQGHWVSDYTYRKNKDDGLLAVAAASPAAPQAPDLAAAAVMVYVTGAADPHSQQGYLEYAYTQETAELSAAALQVWQSYATPTWMHAHAAGAPIDHTHAITYHLRLKDSTGVVLADQALNLLEPDQHGSDPAASPFLATFPAPNGTVARIELMNEETVLDALDIGPGAPAVQVLAPTAGVTISDTLTIRWQATDPDAGDLLHYNVHYSPDGGVSWFPLATDNPGLPGEPFGELTVSTPEALPGSNGLSARVRVMASDGYHTTSAVSGLFTVSKRAPQPAIITPKPGTSLPAGDAAVLRAAAYDAEDGTLADDAFRWHVDGVDVRAGMEQVVPGLRPGAHPVTLTATDSDSQQGVAQATLQIDPLYVPLSGASPVLDGACDEGAYGAGSLLSLAPNGDGAQAAVMLLRNGDRLWVCFSGLASGGAELIGRVALYADVNHSGDPLAQSDDVAFLVDEDGGLFTTVGDGNGGYAGIGPGGLEARVSGGGGFWTAEMQIAASSLGGFGHSLGLAFAHFSANSTEESQRWPYAAQTGQPATWAHTVLGDWPAIISLAPISTTVGSPVVLTVIGERFAPTATVLIDGAPTPTTVISPTQLTANLGAATVANAGVKSITVVNPGLGDAPSNEQRFTVENMTPVIASVSPQSADEEGAGFTLTVQGNRFAPGAIIRWNGDPLPTTVAANGALQAQVDAAQLDIARPVVIVVENPGPGGGVSDAAIFTIESAFRQLLPLVSGQ